MLNNPVAQKLFDLLQQAELAYQLKGQPHCEYLAPFMHQAHGQLKRELTRICALGDQASVFVDYFLKEFDA